MTSGRRLDPSIYLECRSEVDRLLLISEVECRSLPWLLLLSRALLLSNRPLLERAKDRSRTTALFRLKKAAKLTTNKCHQCILITFSSVTSSQWGQEQAKTYWVTRVAHTSIYQTMRLLLLGAKWQTSWWESWDRSKESRSTLWLSWRAWKRRTSSSGRCKRALLLR